MSYTTFADPKGQEWQVWSVNPADLDRRKRDRRDATPSLIATHTGTERRINTDERRNPFQPWSAVNPGFEHGWLCFEKEDGEKRRLIPIPSAWENATAEKLWNWCNEASHVSKRGSAFQIASVKKIEVSQGRLASAGAKKGASCVDAMAG